VKHTHIHAYIHTHTHTHTLTHTPTHRLAITFRNPKFKLQTLVADVMKRHPSWQGCVKRACLLFAADNRRK